MPLAPHHPDWPAAAARALAAVTGALGPALTAAHHIGSTAVPGLMAKPILDLLLEVRDRAALDLIGHAMAGLGYEAMGEFGVPGRRYFRRHDAAGVRTHHVHAFVTGDPHVLRHLAFRDYLRAHAEVAAAYGALKSALAATCPDLGPGYVEGKGPFVRAHQAAAVAWHVAGASGERVVRPEIPTDHDGIAAVHRAAFGRAAEAALVEALRAEVPSRLSLVAAGRDGVQAHVLFTPVTIDGWPDAPLMGLAPLAVAPAVQRQGLGAALVRAGLERCAEAGAVAVVVLGHPEYYPRFGFTRADGYGLGCEFPCRPEAFMVCELRPGALSGRRGLVRYHAAFGAAGA
jgi:predicted N-acetyltransferase YhbS/GrpB-like predicted nucleotidyltransferase (UPF0157 family)